MSAIKEALTGIPGWKALLIGGFGVTVILFLQSTIDAKVQRSESRAAVNFVSKDAYITILERLARIESKVDALQQGAERREQR